MKFETLCLHADNNIKDEWGGLAMPICQSASFVHKSVEEQGEYSYSRLSNPTRNHLENTICALEKGKKAYAFSTGMAAITAVMKLFKPNSHIIATKDLYGGALRLFNNVCINEGISFDFIDTNISNIKKYIKNNTKAIYIETPSNPLMMVSDIKAISEYAHSLGIKVIVDNTFLTPYFQRPLELGADIVIHSGTKYLGGHNDTLAGFVICKSEEDSTNLGYIYKTIGSCLSPFDSFLIERGIKTLPIRMDRINYNASILAKFLANHPRVVKVYYVGFSQRDDYEISIKQASGFGGMISFEVESEELARQVLREIKIFQYAESLGGVDSLITYPKLQTHADVPREEREARGINDRFLRMSVGIENIDDLINDIKEALRYV